MNFVPFLQNMLNRKIRNQTGRRRSFSGIFRDAPLLQKRRRGSLKTPLPLVVIAFGFAAYLGFLLVSEYTDLTSPPVPPNQEEKKEKEQPKSPTSSPELLFVHNGTEDTGKCLDCHHLPDENSEQMYQEMSDSLGDLADLFAPSDYRESSAEIDLFADPDSFLKKGKTTKGPNNPLIPVGKFKGVATCLECHPQEEYSQQHEGHKFEPQQDCLICHSIHQSPYEPLLIKPKQDLCLLCHEK
ncbi:MAG: cytochrome c3 family protein [Thermoguttaceae bacterium]